MHREFRADKSICRRPELEKIGVTIESLKKARCLSRGLRELDLDACTVKMFIGRKKS